MLITNPKPSITLKCDSLPNTDNLTAKFISTKQVRIAVTEAPNETVVVLSSSDMDQLITWYKENKLKYFLTEG